MTDQKKFYQREIKHRDDKIDELKDTIDELQQKGENISLSYAKQTDRMIKLKEAANELIHLHLCEQEGIVSGQPTSKQWLEAVDKLSELLNPKK